MSVKMSMYFLKTAMQNSILNSSFAMQLFCLSMSPDWIPIRYNLLSDHANVTQSEQNSSIDKRKPLFFVWLSFCQQYVLFLAQVDF